MTATEVIHKLEQLRQETPKFTGPEYHLLQVMHWQLGHFLQQKISTSLLFD
jgi:hypothetical protein